MGLNKVCHHYLKKSCEQAFPHHWMGRYPFRHFVPHGGALLYSSALKAMQTDRCIGVRWSLFNDTGLQMLQQLEEPVRATMTQSSCSKIDDGEVTVVVTCQLSLMGKLIARMRRCLLLLEVTGDEGNRCYVLSCVMSLIVGDRGMN